MVTGRCDRGMGSCVAVFHLPSHLFPPVLCPRGSPAALRQQDLVGLVGPGWVWPMGALAEWEGDERVQSETLLCLPLPKVMAL